jgi:predicted anti-sigma-YlaC factor YlaD
MNCLRLEQIYLYIEGELEPAERRLVERHLDLCPGCRRAVEERTVLHEAALTLPPVEVPPDFSSRVLDRIPAWSPAPLARLMVFAAAAGSFFLVVLGMVLVTGRSLPVILAFAIRSFGDFLGRSATALGKGLEVLVTGFKIAGGFLGGFWKVLEAVSHSFFRPETVAPAIALGLVLTTLLILGMKRFLFTGEKQ